jgi:hypothetical protein
MQWPDKTRFEGEWRHGQRWGEGSLALDGGGVVRGSWRNDRLVTPANIGRAQAAESHLPASPAPLQD